MATVGRGRRRAAVLLFACTAALSPRAKAASGLEDLLLPPAGSRAGSGTFLWFGRAFPEIDMELSAGGFGHNYSFQVEVELYLAEEREGHCFVAPPDMRVSVNGRALALIYKGGPAPPVSMSGVQIHLTNCAPARYRSEGPPFDATHNEAVVVIEQGGKRAEMRVGTFFRPRSVRVEPGTDLHAGDDVRLRWSPASDEWYGYDASTEVRIRRDGKTIASVAKKDGLVARDGHVDFTLPRVPPGPAQLDFWLAYVEPRPRVDTCRGVHRCHANMSGDLPGPSQPIDIRILP